MGKQCSVYLVRLALLVAVALGRASTAGRTLDEVGESATSDASRWDEVGLRLGADALVLNEGCSTSLGRVDHHNHTRLAVLGLGAVDSDRIGALNLDGEAGEGAVCALLEVEKDVTGVLALTALSSRLYFVLALAPCQRQLGLRTEAWALALALVFAAPGAGTKPE